MCRSVIKQLQRSLFAVRIMLRELVGYHLDTGKGKGCLHFENVIDRLNYKRAKIATVQTLTV